MLKELKNLTPWQWDTRGADPGKRMLADFEQVSFAQQRLNACVHNKLRHMRRYNSMQHARCGLLAGIEFGHKRRKCKDTPGASSCFSRTQRTVVYFLEPMCFTVSVESGVF
jgi:hypothetical protein